MKTLLLPGRNPETVSWIRTVADHLDLNPDNCHLHQYTFWTDTNSTLSLSHETAHLPEGEFDLVLCKSLGSLVLMQAVLEKKIRLERAVLIGIPFRSLKKRAFPEEALKLLSSPRVFTVQQVDDPFGPVEEFGVHRPLNLHRIAGNDHLYDVYADYTPEVAGWLKGLG